MCQSLLVPTLMFMLMLTLVFWLTPHRSDGVRPLDCLPTKGFSRKRDGSVPTRNARVLGAEVQHQVLLAISIDILFMTASMLI